MEDCVGERYVLWCDVSHSLSYILAPCRPFPILNVIFTARQWIISAQLRQFLSQGLDAKILLALSGQFGRKLLYAVPCDFTRRGVLKIVAQELSVLNSLLNVLGTELRTTSRARVITLLGTNFESCARHRCHFDI